tara:strand:+ start:970 stop:1170 length:201 start_codon:yes stop_codon:yes gene_type:complete
MSVYQFGNKRPDATRKSKNFGKGRVCASKQCEQVLNQYNKKDHCYQHAPRSYGKNRGWISPERKKV